MREREREKGGGGQPKKIDRMREGDEKKAMEIQTLESDGGWRIERTTK